MRGDALRDTNRVGQLLTIGLGTSVAMWAAGFFCRLPAAHSTSDEPHLMTASATLLAILIACLIGGGWVAGRYLPRWVSGTAWAGLITGVVNLLVIGAAASRDGDPQQTLLSALLWVPGSILLTIVCMLVGAVGGRILSRAREVDPDWRGALAAVGAVATLLLIIIGGTVTGYDAGLAVVDWPNTEGYMMFMYPLSKMTGGLYFEHSHRLLGSLVGLITLVLAVYLQRVEERPWVRKLGWTALVLVIAQGVLGGLRVTGVLTFSTDPNDTRPSITLAIIHGVLGQVYFSVMVGLAVVTLARWRRAGAAVLRAGATIDRRLGIMLYGALLVQLVLGALVRHLMSEAQAVESGWVESLILMHITVAVVVTLVALASGLRAWGLYERRRPLPGLGLALLGLIFVQLILGLLAYVAVSGGTAPPGTSRGWHVLLTTAHQSMGAALLGVTIMLTLWHFRLVAPQADATAVPTTAAPERGT